ncbi:MAG TPA: hypothetical protein VHU83_02190 [Bryobacteraceae bacterium]|nr:hypothetical protein [Bryobacteraceae bacterium]
MAWLNELQRKLNYSGDIGAMLVGPILFTFGVFVAPTLLQNCNSPEKLLKGVPAFVLLVIWAVMFYITRKRERQKLRREMDELNGLEDEQLQRG